jgi:hypothetical protein
MTKEEIEKQIRVAVTKESHSLDFYGMPGVGMIHPCSLRAMTGLIMPLYQEIDRLKSLLLLDKV